ncbi:TetR/AcrR family transcriptional regulator [Pectinatus sottacetonis]|uniref:TetR/AcrR family transcriptional regulator n=1 Tax=Pectinatus sottacetonis TaxID=1002795 RepID=UPI0018C62FED|nr:TetR/AcrR family transcriptional regulator [Pectinatus sottacetonis]
MPKKVLTMQSDSVANKILTTAKKLFVKQGYKKTTIRQIVKESGVLTGSIYHFYKNKEDVFRVLLLLVLKQSTMLINKYFENESPAFRYAAMNIVGIKAAEVNEFVRESYYEGYTANTIFEQMVEYITDISKEMFKNNIYYTREDYYIRTLLVRGAMRSCIAKFYFKKNISSEKCSAILVNMALSLFGFDKRAIEVVLQRLEDLDDKLSEITNQLIKESVKI